MSDEREEIESQLAALFDPEEIKWKPGVISGSRALALCYVDARVVQDRLDNVLGVSGWSDKYTVLPEGSVMCELTCTIAGVSITKTDVGSPSEQPDEGDRMKAAFSDALKRTAVKFGVGRYLYRMPAQWVEYDPQKKRLAKPPELPAAFRPSKPVKTDKTVLENALKILEPAAAEGLEALELAWKSISLEMRRAAKPMMEALKEKAGARAE